GGADFVRGSRYIQGGGSADLSLFRSLGNLALTTVVRLLYRNRFSDLCYGYTAFWRRVLPVLQPEAPGFEIEAQLNTRALAHGLRLEGGSVLTGRHLQPALPARTPAHQGTGTRANAQIAEKAAEWGMFFPLLVVGAAGVLLVALADGLARDSVPGAQLLFFA